EAFTKDELDQAFKDLIAGNSKYKNGSLPEKIDKQEFIQDVLGLVAVEPEPSIPPEPTLD
ncbi:MAG: hypothetical protein SGCHY_004574, partial [Lobulomycetales sp.]